MSSSGVFKMQNKKDKRTKGVAAKQRLMQGRLRRLEAQNQRKG
jgi:hypothetical protein